jgi:hypothetical protein
MIQLVLYNILTEFGVPMKGTVMPVYVIFV